MKKFYLFRHWKKNKNKKKGKTRRQKDLLLIKQYNIQNKDKKEWKIK